ncbi:MAG TPA: mechanosensitive ion channel domain-containing protein [Nitrospiria bacterium]|jgi:small-conductance mechanosensitive channel
MNMNETISEIGSSITPLIQGILEKLPAIFSFFALILIGWILARILQASTSRVIGLMDQFVRTRSIKREGVPTEIERSVPSMMGKIVFWIILVFFFVAATETLGLSIVSNLLSGVANYLPNVLAAALIGFAGYIGGNLARDAIIRAMVSAGIEYGELLARLTQIAIFLVAFLIGIDQIGIQIESLVVLIAMVFGTVLGGMALGFGLGAKTVVGNLIASHYLTQTYQIGQTVRIGEIQGRVEELTPSAVILETPEGRVLIPAGEFSKKHSTLIAERG